jgi:hypothetical protein
MPEALSITALGSQTSSDSYKWSSKPNINSVDIVRSLCATVAETLDISITSTGKLRS